MTETVLRDEMKDAIAFKVLAGNQPHFKLSGSVDDILACDRDKKVARLEVSENPAVFRVVYTDGTIDVFVNCPVVVRLKPEPEPEENETTEE